MKGWCEECGKEIDETEVYGIEEFKKALCINCWEKAKTTKLSPAIIDAHFKQQQKLDWDKFNDGLYWST